MTEMLKRLTTNIYKKDGVFRNSPSHLTTMNITLFIMATSVPLYLLVCCWSIRVLVYQFVKLFLIITHFICNVI